MNPEEDIINKLESDSSEEESFFAFCYEEHNQDNEHIKANRDGLIRFAAFLLRIAYEIRPSKSPATDDEFPIDQSLSIPDEGLLIHYVKLINKKKSDYSPKPPYKETWRDKLIPIGCVVICIFLIAAIGIGIVTMINWLI